MKKILLAVVAVMMLSTPAAASVDTIITAIDKALCSGVFFGEGWKLFPSPSGTYFMKLGNKLVRYEDKMDDNFKHEMTINQLVEFKIVLLNVKSTSTLAYIMASANTKKEKLQACIEKYIEE